MKFYVMICFLLVGWYANAQDPFEEKEFANPTREISIIATEDGFYPNKIMAFKGEKLRFFITSTTEKKQCFILQKHEVFVSADKGRINEKEVVVDQAGRFKFYCPANTAFGHLTVFEKNSKEPVKEIEEKRRKPASVAPSYWMPRDHD